MRPTAKEHLITYDIAGTVFPRDWEDTQLVRSEARRVLARVGVDPPDSERLLVLFASECCFQLAKRLACEAGPVHMSFGLRRTTATPVKAPVKERCACPYVVLAHAVTIVSFYIWKRYALLMHWGK